MSNTIFLTLSVLIFALILSLFVISMPKLLLIIL